MEDELDKKIKEEFEDVSIGTKKTGRIRKIVVDRQGCIGARSCVLVAEKTFQMDDENLAYVTENEEEYEDDDTLIMSAQSCPVLAVHLYDKDGHKIFPGE